MKGDNIWEGFNESWGGNERNFPFKIYVIPSDMQG